MNKVEFPELVALSAVRAFAPDLTLAVGVEFTTGPDPVLDFDSEIYWLEPAGCDGAILERLDFAAGRVARARARGVAAEFRLRVNGRVIFVGG